MGEYLAVGNERPEINFREGGYLFLATGAGLKTLLSKPAAAAQLGAMTVLMTPPELERQFPWLNASDRGRHFGAVQRGWIDPYSLLQAFKKKAGTRRHLSPGRVVDLHVSPSGTLESVTLKRRRHARSAVNCAGYRPQHRGDGGDRSTGLSEETPGLCLRFTGRIENVPLTIDPTGAWFRPEGTNFICGISHRKATIPDCLDFELDYRLFEENHDARPSRAPAFRAIKLVRAWADRYDWRARSERC